MASALLRIPAVGPPRLSYLSSFTGSKISRVKSIFKPCMAIQKTFHSTGHQMSAAVQHYRTEAVSDPYIPVYVMMPLGIISLDGHVLDPNFLLNQLEILKSTGADGVMIDVWWGIVEASPKLYNWKAYRQVFEIVRRLNLKLQVVMSFHECGGNVGDDVHIPIPKWVTQIGMENENIFFTDREGRRNQECLSWGIDEEHVLEGRTALEGGVISEVEIGLGPCGELRFPSYPEKFGWKYPGIGQFQCYDCYLSKSLKKAAEVRGMPAWGEAPGGAGSYNSKPEETYFFRENNGGYKSFDGDFFLKWYSQVLIDHGDKVLGLANLAFKGTPIAAKVSGIHWCFKTDAHAAELTAGFYNILGQIAYGGIISMLKKHEAALNFTCLELRTRDQEKESPGALADPEDLVWQDAWNAKIVVAGENALPCYHREGYDKIIEIAKPPFLRDHLSSFTYLRLCPILLEEPNLMEFKRFVGKMHGVQA